DSEQCLRPANSLHKPSLSVHAAQHDDGTRPEPLVANDKLVLNGRCVRYLEIFFADETTLGDCFKEAPCSVALSTHIVKCRNGKMHNLAVQQKDAQSCSAEMEKQSKAFTLQFGITCPLHVILPAATVLKWGKLIPGSFSPVSRSRPFKAFQWSS